MPATPTTGSPSTDAYLYGDTVRRIRAAGDLVVMPTLGANTLPDPADRVAPLLAISEDPETRPDLLPIDLGSFNLDPYDAANRRFRAEGLVYHNPVSALRYLAEVIVKAGVRPAAVLWSIGSARLLGAFIEMGVLAEPVYAELTLSQTLLATHPGTVRGLQALVDFLPAGMRGEWSVLSVGGSLLPLVRAGGRRRRPSRPRPRRLPLPRARDAHQRRAGGRSGRDPALPRAAAGHTW